MRTLTPLVKKGAAEGSKPVCHCRAMGSSSRKVKALHKPHSEIDSNFWCGSQVKHYLKDEAQHSGASLRPLIFSYS